VREGGVWLRARLSVGQVSSKGDALLRKRSMDEDSDLTRADKVNDGQMKVIGQELQCKLSAFEVLLAGFR
jgi:hypothetical protein